MFKRYSAAIVILLSALASAGQVSNKQSYKFTIDLRNVNDDKIKVDLITPVITQKTIAYHLPKIVPGTYSEDDYGRYVEEFTALDKKGNKLNVVRADTNSWTISGADKLYRISYLVNDSYDDRSTKQVIFEPAGSNIQKDTNYILNNHCFLGYFDNMKNVSYEINIKHPANFYGSTALIDLDKSNVTDKFITGSYNSIVDNPFMYNVPDTTVIKVGKTEVLVSVYSPSKRISSKFLTSKLEPLLLAQTKYLGGKLPVEKYAFIIYLTGRRGVSGGIGALEHSFSSLYFLLDSEPDQLSTFVSDASAHEFFHIITPLSIHSEEIQNFDFNHPRMSRHLWLYEGSTEYHAQMVQEKYGLISPEELLKRLSGKITASKNSYNDTVPFTVMSKEVLGAYERQFGNVYQKGALINMCLDIKLLQHSNGKHGIMKMIRDLSNKYGNQKGFVDATLFNEIEKLTYPEIKQFLETYVGGSKPLPFEEIFNTVGIKYIPEVETKDSLFSSGAVTFRFNQTTGRLRVADVSKMNALGKKLGYQRSDEIVSINGDVISAANFNSYLRNFGKNSKEGDDLVIKVVRKDQNGADTTVELKATMSKFPVFKYNVLEFENDATPQQLLIRNAWLKPNDLQKN